MLNNDKSKSIAILVLGSIAIVDMFTSRDISVVLAIVGFIGGILVSKS